MKSQSSMVRNALQQALNLHSKARVVGEWSHNRYTPISKVDNFNYEEDTYGYDLEMYPIETIVEGNRPTAGMLKARAGEGVTSVSYGNDSRTGYRTYVASPDALYKYWTSPAQSNTTPFPGGGFVLPRTVSPYVLYSRPAITNKLYVCIENSWASPAKWDVQITTNGTTWTTVASDQALNSKGQLELYRQEDDSWSTTVYRNNPISLRGIRLVISSMARQNSWFNLVELGARLELDLSDYLIDYGINEEVSDSDQISPIGVASSNTATVTLSNIEGMFNNDNPDSILNGLIDANVKFTIDAGIDISNWGGTSVEYIRMATMYAEVWEGNDETVEVNLKDSSKFLQEIKPLSDLIENASIGEIIWRLVESVGFNNYQYTKDAEVGSPEVPYYWTDHEKTVWENIQDICRGTQNVVYFDAYDVMRIKTREAAYNKSRPDDWTLDYAQRGSKRPDIVELDTSGTFEANSINVNYRPTGLSMDAQGRPISEIIWEPEGDVVLRTAPLSKPITSKDVRFWIPKSEVVHWPYESLVNIRGELIRYRGKGYRYYPKGRAYTGVVADDTIFKVIYSLDEQRQIDDDLSSDDHKWRNYYTGYLRVAERGVDVTTAKNHPVISETWFSNGAYYGTTGGNQVLWNGGMKFRPQDSILRLQTTGKKAGGEHWYTARRGAVNNEPIQFIGTRMRFPSSPSGKHFRGGLWFWGSGDNKTMYAVDIGTTDSVNPRRANENEIRVLRRAGGVTKRLSKGAIYGINTDQWIDIDVTVYKGSISVSINGIQTLRVADPSPLRATGRGGLQVRGESVADFEYFYMMAPGAIQETDLDNSSYLDIVRGGYFSSQFYKNYAGQTRTVKIRQGKKTISVKRAYDQRYFYEFGRDVKEVREYDVKFEKFPVIYSSLYVSNEDQSVLDEYIHDPFGARFIIANAARVNAVVNGEDKVSFGADNPVDQKMMITGRTIQQGEEKTEHAKNEQAVKARGEITLEISSDWIQTKEAAKSLCDWIVNNWSEPSDDVEVQVFGNPLFELGDIVSINYPRKNMSSLTHRYFVTGISNSWDNGLTTSLSLRRARI